MKEAVHHLLQVEPLEDHPDGELRILLRDRHLVLTVAEAHALARLLLSMCSRAEMLKAQAAEVPPPEPPPPPAEPDTENPPLAA